MIHVVPRWGSSRGCSNGRIAIGLISAEGVRAPPPTGARRPLLFGRQPVAPADDARLLLHGKDALLLRLAERRHHVLVEGLTDSTRLLRPVEDREGLRPFRINARARALGDASAVLRSSALQLAAADSHVVMEAGDANVIASGIRECVFVHVHAHGVRHQEAALACIPSALEDVFDDVDPAAGQR